MSKQVIKTNTDTIEIKVSVILLEEHGQFVAYCPALELSSYGETEKEAVVAFDDAVEVFFDETQRKGTLEKSLLRLGWILQQKPRPSYIPPRISASLHNKLLKKNPKKVYDERVSIPVN